MTTTSVPAIDAPMVMDLWRIGAAVLICGDGAPCPTGTCVGHVPVLPGPGERIVIGLPGQERTVYRVTGTPGAPTFEREA